MTLKRLMTTVVVATPAGSPPPYARLGQGVMGGTIAAMVEGDAVDAKLLLEELQHVFGTEFDRGELTVETLRPVLWAAHWLKSVRPVAQRASELLTLAADRAFEPGSKAAKDCQAVAQVMGSVATTEPHCLTAIEAARKIRVPADFYAKAPPNLSDDVAASAMRVDGILPAWALTAEESLEISRRTRDAYVAALGISAGMPASHPDNCPHCDAIPTSGHGCGREGIHQAGQTYDDSPFAVYGYTHEMYAALRQVSEILGGIREVEKQALEPTPDMLKAGVKVLADVDELMGRIDGESGVYRPTVLTDKKMVDEAMRQRDEKDRQAQADAVQRKLDELHTRAVNDRHACKVSARRSLQELERLERGLMALAKAIGPMATDQMLAAMERPA